MNSDYKHSEYCPICKSTDITEFVKILQVPAHCNLLYPSRSEALAAPSGDIHLGYCRNCDHVFNLTFDPSLMEYTQDYENSLHFSHRFQVYATELVEKLIDRYDLHEKDVVEIGSGKGDFLLMLCQKGANRGIGFDPSYVPGPEAESNEVTFVQEFYTEKHAHYKADLIVCRHVLEHIERPHDFIISVLGAVDGRVETAVFFEVPNVLYTLRDLGVWDIIYEHCSYFSPNSLAFLFRNNGFQVLDVSTTFGSQFLTIEARLDSGLLAGQDKDQEKISSLVDEFSDSYYRKVVGWTEQLSQIVGSNHRAVVWGAGSKGVTFLNVLKTQNIIRYVVDINPRKEGMYIAGTGQQIISPEFLKDYAPKVVIIMNPNYREEIQQTLQQMGLKADILLA